MKNKREILKEEIKYYEEQIAKEENKRVTEYLIEKLFEIKEELKKIEDEKKEINVEENIKLVHFTINRYFPDWKRRRTGYFDIEDLESIGMIALVESCKNYDKEKGCKFSTYAIKNIWSKIMRFLEDKHYRSRVNNKKITNIISIQNESLEGVEIQDIIKDEGADVDFQTTVFFDEFLTKLTKFEKEILIMKLNGRNQTQIAQTLGKQQATISRIMKILKNKYKQYENGEEITIKINRRNRPILCKETGEIFHDTRDIAKKYNMNRGVIYNVLCGNNTGKYRGLTFRYVEE